MNEETYLLRKTNCENCGSSDANAVYSNGNTHCFSCNTTVFADNKLNEEEIGLDKEFTIPPLEYPNAIRGINRDILTKFKYGVVDGKHLAYMYNANGDIVATKSRSRDKTFAWSGNNKSTVLFGQHLYPKPNKKLSVTITEGEIDALTIASLDGAKWPTLSVTNGAPSAAKQIKKHMEYLLGFKEIVLCFDMDEVGRKAAEEVAKMFPPSFVRIAALPLKDANDMLKEGRTQELRNALRDAKVYTPDGILSGDDILYRLQNEKEVKSYPFPDFLPETNKKTLGIRLGELDVWTSGTGSGKTTLLKQFQYHYYKNTDLNQGLIHLEEPLEDTVKDLCGIAMETRLNMSSVPKEQYMEVASELFTAVDDDGYNRFQVYDSFGSMDSEDLYNKIRYMVNGLNCNVIWLDHLSILVSGMGNEGDERRTIDKLMHELKSLTVELKCYIGLIVHLNNNTMLPFENGGVPTLNNLRGSGGIKQLANGVYAFSRNQQAEDENERNTSQLSVLKCRYTGQTGPSDKMFYNGFTGKLEEYTGQAEEAKSDGGQESSDF